MLLNIYSCKIMLETETPSGSDDFFRWILFVLLALHDEMMRKITDHKTYKSNGENEDYHGHANLPEEKMHIRHVGVLNDDDNKHYHQNKNRGLLKFHDKPSLLKLLAFGLFLITHISFLAMTRLIAC